MTEIRVGDVVAWDKVPDGATAEDLRTLAEVFEVRESLRADDQLSLLMEADGVVRVDHIEDEQTQAKRLHRAGWRPGMTAEDAARLLAEANK